MPVISITRRLSPQIGSTSMSSGVVVKVRHSTWFVVIVPLSSRLRLSWKTTANGTVAESPEEAQLRRTVTDVLDDAQTVWTQTLPKYGQTYQDARLVLTTRLR